MAMNMKSKWNGGWQFSKQPLGSELAQVAAEGDWMPVTLPHDWLIYNTHDLYENSEGWYRKILTLDEVPADRCLSLRFEGVYMNSTLYVNGQIAGEWKYGYSTFEFEITPFLIAGDNTIIMRVIHESPNSRWYSGAGIYRPVWLHTYPKTHIVSDGIYIAARPADGGIWTVDVDSELHFAAGGNSAALKLRHTVLDAGGAVVAQAESAVPAQGGDQIVHAHSRLEVEQPQLWDIDNPRLYTLKTELLGGDTVTQEETQSFGFRTMELDS